MALTASKVGARVAATPLMNRLFASVPPLVKTTSVGCAPNAAATCWRARSMASRAARPYSCRLDALPYCVVKNGNIAVPVGKFSFEPQALVENGSAVIDAVVKARPETAKGSFVNAITLSATMSPGLAVDPAPYLKN